MQIDIHLRDLGESLVRGWQREFVGVPSVKISCGDIFSDKVGVVGSGDAIDIHADAIVSPANSFGFMDGGIDAVYTYQLGPDLATAVGRMPVGRCAHQMRVAWDRVLGGKPLLPTSIRTAANDDDLLR